MYKIFHTRNVTNFPKFTSRECNLTSSGETAVDEFKTSPATAGDLNGSKSVLNVCYNLEYMRISHTKTVKCNKKKEKQKKKKARESD
jgi:hypothetical protein